MMMHPRIMYALQPQPPVPFVQVLHRSDSLGIVDLDALARLPRSAKQPAVDGKPSGGGPAGVGAAEGCASPRQASLQAALAARAESSGMMLPPAKAPPPPVTQQPQSQKPAGLSAVLSSFPPMSSIQVGRFGSRCTFVWVG